jgi:hypothetical protein
MICCRILFIIVLIVCKSFCYIQAQVKWANKWGGSTTDMANALCVDQAGNTIVTGSFSTTAKLGSEELSSIGGGDVFVASFNAQGKLNWWLQFGSKGDDFGSAINTNSRGDIVVTGIYSGHLEIADKTLLSQGSNDVFLLLLDASGKVKQLFSPGLGTGAYPSAVAINNNGRIALSGWFSQLTNNGTSKAALGETDFFIMNVEATGKINYCITGGGLGLDECNTLSIDDDGSVYAAGSFVKAALLGPEELNGRDGANAFFTKINHNGVITWYKTLNSLNGNVIPQHITHNNIGEAFAVGLYSDTIWDKGFVNFAQGQNDVFCIKINSNGNYSWLQTGGSDQPDKSYAVDIKDGRVRWCGLCSGNATFGKKKVSGMRDKGLFILELDAKTGKLLNKKSWQRGDNAVDNMARFSPISNAISLCGYFTYKFDTGLRTLHSAGEEDAFLLHFGL